MIKGSRMHDGWGGRSAVIGPHAGKKQALVSRLGSGGLRTAGGYSGDPVDGPGECLELDGFNDILCMSWRSDNAGPPDADEASPPPKSFSIRPLCWARLA
jgi:hypothetical protein